MLKVFNYIKNLIWNNKGLLLAAVFALLLLVPSVFGINKTQKSTVLAATTKASATPTPTSVPTLTPSPTFVPKPITQAPTIAPTSIPASTQNTNTTSSTNNSTPTPTATPTPSPTPSTITVKIGIDYAGIKSNDSYNVSIQPGQTAWDSIVAAVGEGNLEYTDYGGNFGKFITGFNGVAADSNSQFYSFNVNGASSNIGVSGYICQNGDQLDFVLTNF